MLNVKQLTSTGCKIINIYMYFYGSFDILQIKAPLLLTIGHKIKKRKQKKKEEEEK